MIEKVKCVICGEDSIWMYCDYCKSQARDFFIDAVAQSMDWLDIDSEKASGLGYDIMEDFVNDEDLREDVENHLRWMKEERRRHGEVTKDSVRTESK